MQDHSRTVLLIVACAVQGFHAAPISNTSSTQPTANTSSQTLMQGWTPSPSGRGTIDIVWSCVITVFLCSWSVLCLQIPAEKDSRFDILWRRSWLTALCALGPEFTLQLALGQWSSARQSVRDFHESGFPEWTINHAFYANSGGFILRTPDFKPIPIDAKQLLYLIKRKYLRYPALSEQDIDDKNKMDILLRLISTGQIIWFSVTLIARGIQGLIITGMELTTVAFILCSFGTTYCWWHKGADVATPVKLTTATTLAQILKEGGDAAAQPYHRTPLDFISRDEWHWSLYWAHWINILRKLHIVFAPKALPHDRLENTIWPDIKARGALPAFIMMCLAYSAIFMAGWNNHFPTNAEQLLWRISSLSMMSAVVLYFLITAFTYVVYPAFQRFFQNHAITSLEAQNIETPLQSLSNKESKEVSEKAKSATHLENPSLKRPKARSKLSSIAAGLRNNSIIKDPLLNVPLKATLPMYVVGFLYCSSRTLLIILDIIQLRSLPLSAFATVDWGAFFPHLS